MEICFLPYAVFMLNPPCSSWLKKHKYLLSFLLTSGLQGWILDSVNEAVYFLHHPCLFILSARPHGYMAAVTTYFHAGIQVWKKDEAKIEAAADLSHCPMSPSLTLPLEEEPTGCLLPQS